MHVVVALAFEAVQHVDDLGKPGSQQRRAGLDAAMAAAANQYHRPVQIAFGQAARLGDEVAVGLPVLAVVPRQMNRAYRMSDKVVFDGAAYIQKQRLLLPGKELMAFVRSQMSHGAQRLMNRVDSTGKYPGFKPKLLDVPAL